MSDDEFDDLIDAVCKQSISEIEVDEWIEASRPALSVSDLEIARNTLSAWNDVETFKANVDEFCSRCDGRDWFKRPQLKFLHEAFVLARFAIDNRCDAVKIASSLDQWPDGYVRRLGKVHNIEIVSTHGGRKLGEEYANNIGPRIDPLSEWIKRAESIPFHLKEVIRKKLRKRYSAPCWLVVYLNIDEWGIRHSQIVEQIKNIKNEYSAHFEAISVRWKGSTY